MAARKARTGGRRPLVHRGVELHCSWQFEQEARADGCARVAGADEVGRGALCGPVVAAAVVLGEGFDTEGIDDSKRLTERQRDEQAVRIRAGAVAVEAPTDDGARATSADATDPPRAEIK